VPIGSLNLEEPMMSSRNSSILGANVNIFEVIMGVEFDP
jgi:hypothetical protein